jgi:hypothetical protein
MLLGFTLPGRILLAGQYASNSLVVANTFNEWEALARWGAPPLGPVGLAMTGAYNGAAESVDGEVSVRLPIPLPEAFPADSIQLLGALRGFSDAVGSGESGWFAGGGVLVHLGSGVSLAGDVGQLESDGVDPVFAWGAGLQLRIPFTPHSLSLQATNTRTNTLQGASVGFETVWGFEFTVPLTYARFFPD